MDRRLLNPGCALRDNLSDQVVVSICGPQKMVPVQRADVFWFVNSGYLFFAPLSHSIKSCGFQVTVAVALVFGARVMLAATFQARRPTPKVISQVILACGMCFTEFSC